MTDSKISISLSTRGSDLDKQDFLWQIQSNVPIHFHMCCWVENENFVAGHDES